MGLYSCLGMLCEVSWLVLFRISLCTGRLCQLFKKEFVIDYSHWQLWQRVFFRNNTFRLPERYLLYWSYSTNFFGCFILRIHHMPNYWDLPQFTEKFLSFDSTFWSFPHRAHLSFPRHSLSVPKPSAFVALEHKRYVYRYLQYLIMAYSSGITEENTSFLATVGVSTLLIF